MRSRLLIATTIVFTLAIAAPALAIEVAPTSQSGQYGAEPARVDVTGLPPGTSTLLQLVRANGKVVNKYKDAAGDGTLRFGWQGKKIGTDTLRVCTDALQDGVCDGPAVESTMTWTQYPAIRSYKKGVAGVATATFDDGRTASFNINVACQPSFFPRQGFFLIAWTDDGNVRHRFTSDYVSTNSCTLRADGGYNLDTYGWGRDELGKEYPYKIIVSVPNGAPTTVRFGVDMPGGGDFLNGVLKSNSKLQYISG